LYWLKWGFACVAICSSPVNTYTGALAKVNPDGTLSLLADGLNQQTSLEIIKNTAYVVTLTGVNMGNCLAFGVPC